MKVLFLIYDVDFDEDVMDMLAALSVTGYTKWGRVLGKGVRSQPKLDDAVWPGFNCAVMIALKKEDEPSVFKSLEDLHKQMGEKGLKVFSWPLERVI
ncbi:MAG: transcriptional regulator [Thermodesulfobacteriota bacterium]|nr:transcriptional regulator [Thermodesulfobacteriota bacterium]